MKEARVLARYGPLTEKRVAMADAKRKFAGRYVVFADLERDDSGAAVSGAVAGVFDNYTDLYTRCKASKGDIEVGLFGPDFATPSLPNANAWWKQAAKNLIQKARSESVRSHLLRQRHDNVGKAWGEYIGVTTGFPLVSQSFSFLWLKEWIGRGGYTPDDIDQSFLYRTGWLHRNPLHGVVKGDRLGIHKYGLKFASLYEHLVRGGGYEPVKLKMHSTVDYEILDGHHRAACLALSGNTRIRAFVDRESSDQSLTELGELRERVAEKGLPYYDLGLDGVKRRSVVKGDSWQRFASILKGVSLANDATLLDVGCHIGFFTVLFGCYGLEAKGINPSARELEIAFKYAKILASSATFEQSTLGEMLRANSNQYDITLLLNVFYSVIKAEGKDQAVDQLRELLKRTRKYLFFSTSMPGDTGAQQWQGYAMTHDEIVGVLDEHGEVTTIGQDRDYQRNIYKVTLGG